MMASGCNEICRSPPPLPRFSTVVWGMLAPVEDVSISIILSGSPRGHTLLFVQEAQKPRELWPFIRAQCLWQQASNGP